jgi:biopolymer transport protein ExbD
MPFGRLERRTPADPISEINMTPLIDVMLVLLVIFIVAAPLMAAQLRLDLPRADAPAATAPARATLTLALQADGQLLLDSRPASLDELRDRVREAARRDAATEVHLHADQTVPYGRVAEVIALVQAGGLTRVGLATRPAR